MKQKVWVLTTEYNQYDQYGEYFVAAFAGKPSLSKLSDVITKRFKNLWLHQTNLEHIWATGGRIKDEDQWFNLYEEELL